MASNQPVAILPLISFHEESESYFFDIDENSISSINGDRYGNVFLGKETLISDIGKWHKHSLPLFCKKVKQWNVRNGLYLGIC